MSGAPFKLCFLAMLEMLELRVPIFLLSDTNLLRVLLLFFKYFGYTLPFYEGFISIESYGKSVFLTVLVISICSLNMGETY